METDKFPSPSTDGTEQEVDPNAPKLVDAEKIDQPELNKSFEDLDREVNSERSSDNAIHLLISPQDFNTGFSDPVILTDNSDKEDLSDSETNSLIFSQDFDAADNVSSLSTQDYLNFLQNGELTKHIQARLRAMVMEELSRLSPLLREALRDWIKKVQEAQNNSGCSQQQMLSYEKRIHDLVEENKKLKRATELKEKESKLMLTALNRLLNK